MIGPLGYLAARSTRNRLVRQLRRLRTPRYALALLLGLAYLWFVGVRQRPASGPTGVRPETLELLAAAGVTAVLLWTWIFGADRRALAFSRAEVTWLFPAPVTRRQLIQYKLLRGQFVILFNVFLWTFLLSRGWAGTGPWRRAGAIWILLTTLALHRLGVALLRSSLLEHGRTAIRARAVTLILVGIVAIAVLVDVLQAAPALGGAWDLGLEEFLAAAHDVAVRPVTAALLLPGRLLVRPMLAPSWAEWGRAILPATAILMAHYVWVIRSDAAFEESAAAVALARHRAGRRTGRTPRFTARPIPRLAPAGWPAGALLWKNLASVVRTGRARGILLGFAAAALAVVVLSAADGSVISNTRPSRKSSTRASSAATTRAPTAAGATAHQPDTGSSPRKTAPATAAGARRSPARIATNPDINSMLWPRASTPIGRSGPTRTHAGSRSAAPFCISIARKLMAGRKTTAAASTAVRSSGDGSGTSPPQNARYAIPMSPSCSAVRTAVEPAVSAPTTVLPRRG